MIPQSTPFYLIRPASESDSESVYAFICELEEIVLDRVQFENVFRHNLINPLVRYLIAEWNGQAVGFASCHIQFVLHHTGKVAEIQELYVHPDYRNQRIGQALVTAIDALARQQGAVNLEVTTNQKRSDTIRFYEREHFVRTHVKLVKPI